MVCQPHGENNSTKTIQQQKKAELDSRILELSHIIHTYQEMYVSVHSIEKCFVFEETAQINQVGSKRNLKRKT